MRLAILLFSYFIGLSAHAQSAPAKPDCTFIPRENIKDFTRDLSTEVIGWTTCYEKDPKLGTFTVARFQMLSDKPVNDFLFHLARQLSPDALKTVIVRENNEKPGHRHLMLRSLRNNGNYEWLYVFTGRAPDGKLYVFIHSGNQEDTLSNEPSLRELRSQLTQPGFLSKLSEPSAGQNP